MEDQVKNDIVSYPLQRDFQASIRLYFQHYMWQRQLGYLLHPKVPMKNGFKVADIACGTGIWLLDVAKEHPKVQCDGYDISTEQFPASGWLPTNVNLSTLNILEPIPKNLQGYYDVVHVGLVVLVVENDNPVPVLENLLSLLRPGGYLQWDEADFGGLVTSAAGQSSSHSALEQLKQKVHKFLYDVKGVRYGWVTELQNYFENSNVTVVDNKFVPIDDDIAHPWTLQHLMAAVELIKSIDRPPGSATDWWKVYEAAAEETYHGGSMRMAMISCVGRKPGKEFKGWGCCTS